MENRKIIEIKSYYFEINTIDRSLARMIRGKKSTESANIRFYRPSSHKETPRSQMATLVSFTKHLRKNE